MHPERQTIMVSLYSEKRSTRVPAHVPMDSQSWELHHIELNKTDISLIRTICFVNKVFVLQNFVCSVFAAVYVNS